VQNNTERKDIRASVLGTAENLFRAPVGGGAADGGIGLMAGQASHTEVGELNAIFVGNEYVGRLDVSVNNGSSMSDGKSGSDMTSPFASRGIGNATLGYDFFKRLAFDHFHDQKGSLCGFVDAHVMDHDDVGVRELSDDAGFAEEKVAGVATDELWREEFDGNGTVYQGIVSADDTAVGANAESFVNLIATDLHDAFLSALAGSSAGIKNRKTEMRRE
jgi:hypothetical protein